MAYTRNEVIVVSEKCFALRKCPFKTIVEAVGSISGIGSLVKIMLVSEPEEDPVMEKLQDLERKIDELADKMNANFIEMKSFLSEFHFCADIIVQTSKLTKYMKDLMEQPGDEAIKNFENAYKTRTLLDLAYTMIGLLEQDATNPLKKAMDADPLKTSTTFNNWKNIIDGVLGQFLFLEAFACGLLKNENKFDCERLVERSNTLLEEIEKWRDDYKKDESYWPELKKFLGEYQDSHTHLTLAQKTSDVLEILKTILTTDMFYLSFFDEKWYLATFFAYYVSVEDQLIESRKRGNCSAVIYRSKQALSVEIEKLEQMKREVESLETPLLKSTADFNRYPRKIFNNPIQNAGFICLCGPIVTTLAGTSSQRWPYGAGYVSEDLDLVANSWFGKQRANVIVGYL